MDNYRYTFTWNTAGIKKDERRADVSYAARKFEYQYGNRSMLLQISDKKITLTFCSKTLLTLKTLKKINKDILEKIYVIYTMIYSYGPIMTGSSVLYEKYNTKVKKYERTEVADPLPAEALIGFFMVQGAFAETAIPFNTETWTSDQTILAYLNMRATDLTEEQNRLKASVYAWILAKSKWPFYERFQYLWIAYNSLYFHFGRVMRWRVAHEVEAQLKKRNIVRAEKKSIYAREKLTAFVKDTCAVENMAKMQNLFSNYKIKKAEIPDYISISKIADSEEAKMTNRHYAAETDKLIAENWDHQLITVQTLQNEHKKIAEGICDMLNLKVKENRKAEAAYRYLITTYLYKCLRCRFFHGGRPVPLFGKSDDQQIIAFELACSMVEDMLEKFLFPSIILKDSIVTVEEADARLRILTGGDAKKAKTAYNQHLKNVVDTLVESYIQKEEAATCSACPGIEDR